ncbi:SdrD B-like domain-containing protein [Curtobacterium sp. Leaf261]|uniref:SdrD B-like domain-containing protein n=1 Tax=Curtobacterium sp. Leaf261 TaxID=1736311 RepID=UPI0006FD628D|nr:SdrD B-like domain-containing protein [Curtobacterium sp. Leaf261]KQO64833.1 hypothetical protein ASF23_01195 [Curtobacterium sp. Leaf261]
MTPTRLRHLGATTLVVAVLAATLTSSPAVADDDQPDPPGSVAAAAGSDASEPDVPAAEDAATSRADVRAAVAMAITVTSDGSGAFTPTQQPGGDTSITNGLVRTFDSITYGVTVNSNGGASENETFTVTAPDGTSWAGLPAPCVGAGSGIVGQVLTCNLGTIREGDAKATPVVLNVSGERRNGDEISISGRTTADNLTGVPALATSPITTVSAAPRYDLSKDVSNSQLFGDVAGPDGTDGIVLRYPIAVAFDPVVPGQGLLGLERSDGNFSFTDDVSRMSGGTTSGALLWGRHGEPACGANDAQHFVDLPGGSGGTSDSVLDSGTISCSQTAPGGPVAVSITGARTDVTKATIPSSSASGGAIAGGSKAYVVSGYIDVWIPQPPVGSSFLAHDEYTPLQTTSTSGAQNYPGGSEPLTNNVATRNVSSFAGPDGFKVLTQVSDEATGATSPGSAKSGDPYVTAGRVVRSQVSIVNPGTSPYEGAIACDVFDNRHQTITPIGDNGYAAGFSWDAGMRIEYTAFSFSDPADGRDATCDDTDGPWYSSPEDVPGGPAAVGKIRAVGGIKGGIRANLFSYMRVLPAPSGTRVLDFGQLSSGDGTWVHDSHDADLGAGGLADSVIETRTLARVTKKVIDPGHTAADTPDKTSFTVSGGSVEFGLYPTLTNSTTGAKPEDVTVVDLLPAHTTYRPDSASRTPTTIETVVDAEGISRQQLTWVLPDTTPGVVLDPITYRVDVSLLSPAGPITNDVTVSAPDDLSPERYRHAVRSLDVVTTGGVGVTKTAVAPTVIAGDELRWELGYTNTDSSAITGADIIDVLPHNGDELGTDHSGQARLAAPIVVDAEAGEIVRYTDTEPADVDRDGNAASNQAGGSTTWCSDADLGTVDCPSDLADVTAFRIERAAGIAVGQTITHQVAMSTVGAVAGDVHVNRFGLRASNLALPVLSNAAKITTVAGSIGDRVWEDANGNGLQDEHEDGIRGVAIAIAGEDDRGTHVHRTTRTDGSGTYGFGGLRPGSYVLTFSAPEGRSFTAAEVGDDRTIDSDAAPDGRTKAVRLVATSTDEGRLDGVTSDLTVDAGVLPVSIDPVITEPDPVITESEELSTTGQETPGSRGGGTPRTVLAFTGADIATIGVIGGVMLFLGAAFAARACLRHRARRD